ncbi:glycosyltransferase family 2 protein [Longirhabdus pacifica]|uniref:glycosyltransferase family 2 protein n=1 Tax=Longirhabdus pacifica TaxID=2305227 RepID=UPI0010093BEA|nr:glycosyltransferase [Longirhabdus pacifica]
MQKPSVDIVIPIYNQSLSLQLTLEGFTRQTASMDNVNIIVVDDGSQEDLSHIIQSFQSTLPLQYFALPRSGRAVARNTGIEKGTGEMLIFCDGDRIPCETFIEEHVTAQTKAQDKNQSLLVVGQVDEMYVSHLEQNMDKARQNAINQRHRRTPQYCKLIYNLFDQHGNTTSPIAWLSTLTGNLSCARALWENIGGFDPLFREWGFEHFEFGYRAFLEHTSFVYCKQAINTHIAHHRNNDMYIQHIKQSHAYFYEKHATTSIAKLLDFMLGTLSLEQYEELAAQEVKHAIPMLNPNQQSFVRIQNF